MGVNFSQENITPVVLFSRVIITSGVIIYGYTGFYMRATLAFNGFNDELPHSFKFRIFLNSFSMSLSMCFTSISLMG